MGKQLPEIKLMCRNGHTFPTRARGGQAVACPECRRLNPDPGHPDHRVNVWVSKTRPRTERERAGLPAEAPEPDPALTARWAREPAWAGKIGMVPGRAADDCPDCGEPLMWEPGRTVVFCNGCRKISLPAAVAEHYRRQDQRSAEVATRAAPDTAAVRSARVRLRALQQRMADQVTSWLDAFDPDELSGPVERLALDYRAELAAYLPEIKNAASEAVLAEIMAEITAVLERAENSGALAAIERHREAIERQAELAERQAELAEQAEWEAREAERKRREAERRAEVEARTQRRAIEAPAARKPITAGSSNGYVGAAVTVAGLIQGYRQDKERKLARFGSCAYEHKKPVIAERRYWITTLNWQGSQTGYELPNSPSAGVCRKHFALADKWMEEQAALLARQRNANVKAVYSELK